MKYGLDLQITVELTDEVINDEKLYEEFTNRIKIALENLLEVNDVEIVDGPTELVE